MATLDNILQEELEVSSDLILKLISLIDLTSLNNTDNTATIQKLVDTANLGYKNYFPAAVCVFSNFGDFAKKLVNPDINVAVVSTCFPSGQTIQSAKLLEIECVNNTQVDEVDIVISRGEFLAGNFNSVSNEILEIRKRLPKKHLKVILETGELTTEENIRKASQIAIGAGADFIKTSTGKMAIGSTPEAVYYMCNEIAEHFNQTGHKVGIKPAGGIRNLDDAIIIYKIVKKVLGEDWLNSNLLRIGASSLYTNLIDEHKTRFCS